MGTQISKIKEPILTASENMLLLLKRRKRKYEAVEQSEFEELLHVPKKKKLITTTQYIYQALFVEEKNSDITVMALGKTWNLHKVYLCQSPYFCSMFNGSWKESSSNFVHVQIYDPKITLQSLNAIFGSLYLDEISIEPISVVSVLATATLFQLDGIIDKCSEVMIETTNAETAISYYEASCQYGVKSVKSTTFRWLLTNLMLIYNKNLKWLKLINTELMCELISSPDLYVMQTEFDLYGLLRRWMFLKLHPNYEINLLPISNYLQQELSVVNMPSTSLSSSTLQLNESEKGEGQENTSINIFNNSHKFFANRKDKTAFILSKDGLPYKKVYEQLRIQHLINHHIDLELMLKENILPKEWLYPYLLSHWNSILKIDHSYDFSLNDVDQETFFKNCLRCGRELKENGIHKWRWTGFYFGLDLIITLESISGKLCIKRYHRGENGRLLSLKHKRQIIIRVTVSTLNEQRQPLHTQTSGIKLLDLERNDEALLLTLNKEMKYPLLVSVNLLLFPPDKQLQLNKEINCEENANINNSSDNNQQISISEIGANFYPNGLKMSPPPLPLPASIPAPSA